MPCLYQHSFFTLGIMCGHYLYSYLSFEIAWKEYNELVQDRAAKLGLT